MGGRVDHRLLGGDPGLPGDLLEILQREDVREHALSWGSGLLAGASKVSYDRGPEASDFGRR